MNTLVFAACVAVFALVFVYIGWYAYKESNPRDGRFCMVLAAIAAVAAVLTGWLGLG